MYLTQHNCTWCMFNVCSWMYLNFGSNKCCAIHALAIWLFNSILNAQVLHFFHFIWIFMSLVLALNIFQGSCIETQPGYLNKLFDFLDNISLDAIGMCTASYCSKLKDLTILYMHILVVPQFIFYLSVCPSVGLSRFALFVPQNTCLS